MGVLLKKVGNNFTGANFAQGTVYSFVLMT
jgi:hypothetical protein